MVTQLFEIETVLRQGIATESLPLPKRYVQAGPKCVGLCVAGLEVNSPVVPHHATNK